MQPERLRSGGSFLIEESLPADTFTAEDLTEEHAAIAETVDRFWDNEIAPNLDAIQAQRPGAARSVMKKAAGLGLMGLFIPERFGGMEMDLVSGLVVAEHTARDGSYSIWEGGHTGIGTLPLVYFGTEEQKQRYLPRLARLDMLAAYALTEPQAGSDALAVRTRADLSPDGRHYVLNGQKMWISNASDADLFTVFAKVGGDRFTAFLVERGFEGLRVGAEEKKMGLRGSSTTALYLDEVPIPVENVLGEIGRGHVIAFNILNIGRLKMGASNVGAAKDVLKHSISYAKARHAFGSPIASFGAIQHKLAEMAIRIFATESIVWRTAGSIQGRSEAVSGDASDAAEQKLKAVEEFAIECSMVKVFGSEMLDYVVDEGVQIHGGYGYHEDYIVERAYRDSRIHRIFEGTNEINRLLIPRMLLKRDRAGRLRLAEHLDRASASQVDREPLANAKTIIKTCLGLALRAHPEDLDLEQEILMLIADMLIDTYAMESVALRVRKGPETAGTQAIQSVFLADRMARIEFSARRLLAACSSDSNDRSDMERLGRLASTELTDTIRLRRRIAETLIESDRYAF